MSGKTHVERLREAYLAWHDAKAADPSALLALCADQISFGSLGDVLSDVTFERKHYSKAEVREYLETLPKNWEMLHFTMSDYIAEGDRVVAFGTCAWRNRVTGKLVDTAKIDVWRFQDGRAIEFYEFFDTAKVLSAMAGPQ